MSLVAAARRVCVYRDVGGGAEVWKRRRQRDGTESGADGDVGFWGGGGGGGWRRSASEMCKEDAGGGSVAVGRGEARWKRWEERMGARMDARWGLMNQSQCLGRARLEARQQRQKRSEAGGIGGEEREEERCAPHPHLDRMARTSGVKGTLRSAPPLRAITPPLILRVSLLLRLFCSILSGQSIDASLQCCHVPGTLSWLRVILHSEAARSMGRWGRAADSPSPSPSLLFLFHLEPPDMQAITSGLGAGLRSVRQGSQLSARPAPSSPDCRQAPLRVDELELPFGQGTRLPKRPPSLPLSPQIQVHNHSSAGSSARQCRIASGARAWTPRT